MVGRNSTIEGEGGGGMYVPKRHKELVGPASNISNVNISREGNKDTDKAKPVLSGMNAADDVWHTMSSESVLAKLNTTRTGLSTVEANKRLDQYGLNQLTEKDKKTLLQRIWGQINNVLVAILIVVAIISIIKAVTAKTAEDAVTNWVEVGLIILVIVLNAWIGIVQEGSAEKSADALKSMLSSDAEVIRNGSNCHIPANELVPGDIVVVNLGDRIPADIRMVEVANLACQEAALTGESLPIDKMTDSIDSNDPASVPLGDRKNMCFSATLVSQGRGVGVVVTTGDYTQIGTINSLVNNVEDKQTEVQKQIDGVSKLIAIFVMIVCLVTFLVSYLYIGTSPLSAVSIALVCAVAMIPEGLASIVSLTYAWAVSKMAGMNAIIRVLPAVETLGSVTVICSDKTGTLTKNEMTLTALVTSNARYKFDTNCSQRKNTNFVRNDMFMALPADVSRRTGRSLRDEFFKNDVDDAEGVSYVGPNGEINPNVDSTSANFDVDLQSQPVRNGKSPVTEFFQGSLAGGVLCSNSMLGKNGGREGEIGNPTELAIVRAAYFAGADIDSMRKTSTKIAEVPFSSEYKFMATVHEPVQAIDGPGLDDSLVVHVKGAPDRMIPLCSHQARAGLVDKDHIEPINAEYWSEQIKVLSSYGLRVLALCRASVPKDSVQKDENLGPEFVNGRPDGAWLTMVGFCAIMDPPRPECVQAITEAHQAGIRVAMITGDHKDTALAIGDTLGIVGGKYSEALTGPELDHMDEMQLRKAVMQNNVFARASPENKIQIVEALQAENQVCSMTGDGVNDAPALKRANMGVAMGKEGTDVARESAEMILADDNFATIVAAVREGRVVWDNLRKILMVNTAINNAQGMTVLFGMVFGLKDALLSPIQVLYCNMICAVTLGFVLAVEPAEKGIMKLPPRKPGKRLIGRYLWLRIFIGTMALVCGSVGSSFWVRGMGVTLGQMRSQALNTLTFSAISITLSARFEYNSSLNKRVFFHNKYLYLSIVPLVILQVAITYIPGLNTTLFGMEAMNGIQWAIVAMFMVITFLVMEAEKATRRSLKARGRNTDDR